ncbi:MAG TPA: MerR family transcriptional regulator [Longimicrobiaceae bacterium]|nr:MerR family transcriptional regulator [Longimicrobiaceae bacterium]
MTRSAGTLVPRHPIRVVADRTGLSLDVLRVWERRYAVVAPGRADDGQRLYSDADVDRLRLLRRATDAGRSIGRVAKLPTEELAELVREDDAARGAAPAPAGPHEARGHLDRALAAVREMDPAKLEAGLRRAVVALSAADFVDGVAAPLLAGIGEGWRTGRIGVAHEHAASAVLRRVLGFMAEAAEVPGSAPGMVVATPAGQAHEFGALLAAASATAEGWRVTYLGADLPAEEIAAAVRQRGASRVALSLVYPGDDPRLPGERRRLRAALPPGVAVVVGGGAAEGHRATLDEIGAAWVPRLADFRALLHEPPPRAEP